jgi:hypothetical protein
MSEFVRFREQPQQKSPKGAWFQLMKYHDPEDAIRKTVTKYCDSPSRYFSPEQVQNLQQGNISVRDQVALLLKLNVVGDNPTALVNTAEFGEVIPSLWGEDQQEHIVEEVLPELEKEEDVFLLKTWNHIRFRQLNQLVAQGFKHNSDRSIPYHQELSKRIFRIYRDEIVGSDITSFDTEQANIVRDKARKVVNAVSEVTFLTEFEIKEMTRNEWNLGYLYLDTLARSVPLFYETAPTAKRDAYLYKMKGNIESQYLSDSDTRLWQRNMMIQDFRYGAQDTTAVRSKKEKLFLTGRKA